MTNSASTAERLGYSKVTNNVRVSVVPAPLPEQSNPSANIYAFSYTITIENLSPKVVQLLERHWYITSAEKELAEVVGPGVVGVQPTLQPGQSFTYTSGAVINDPFGTMRGTYMFQTEGEAFVEVVIPRFDLAYPVLLH